MKNIRIDSRRLDYKTLNERIRAAVTAGRGECASKIVLDGVNGQRFIAAGIESPVRIEINGIPGNDLGAFMNGPEILVRANAQDAVGNTMSGGFIAVDGHVSDAAGYSMRGGSIIIRDNAGYRTGIHMKEYRESVPTVIIGSFARDFLGEYMAGGRIIVFGIGAKKACGNYPGTGMHGGEIYLPSDKLPPRMPEGLKISPAGADVVENAAATFARALGIPRKELPSTKKISFCVIRPASCRPYGSIYAY
ncbi:MAG: hypothetical protein CVU77_04875 [Elusimicrobia bacterium HGW-Elusimicrobia-1]|jgi:glutamate synthase domain-containing protein 3|nr:MAG: hypothetical protein CVU77_04875 [Elusimicrobia bacterium HGW-Elusimicrobia-1]